MPKNGKIKLILFGYTIKVGGQNKMKDCLILGMALGFIIGAVVVQGNKNAQAIVEQGKKTVEEKISDLKNCLTSSSNSRTKTNGD